MKNPKKIAFIAAFAGALGATTYFGLQHDSSAVDLSENSKFLFLSDIHLDSRKDSTDYGDDTGLFLWNAFLSKADSLITAEKPDFIVYTGDLPAHYSGSMYLPPSARKDHNKDLKTILSGLRKLSDSNKTPLFYLPGNNDALAGDYYSFSDESDKTPLTLVPENKNPYPALNIDSSGKNAPFIIDDKNLPRGYYSAKLTEGLRLIALNTVIYSRKFQNVDGGNQLDYGNEQMTWLNNQLTEAKAAGDKVYIAMHIPPGMDAYGVTHFGNYQYNWVKTKPKSTGSWNNDFLKVVSDHQSTITGILYGHTHMDELRRLYNPDGTEITEVAISCPGVTPQHHNNPGFKMVSYDSTSKELLDFTTYHTFPTVSTWGNKTYNFNQQFGYDSNKNMYENLSSDNIDSIHVKLNKIYTVMHGNPSYDITSGIEVKTEN